jgi:hypothetical protein
VADSELVKTALSPAVMAGMARSIKGLGAGAGMGAVLGGAAGAAAGGIRDFHLRRAEGGSVLQGIGSGLGGAWQGAGKGALYGGLAGGAVGALRPAYAEALATHLPGSARLGQRQAHAFTGVGEPGYIRSIGGGAHDALEGLHAAQGVQQAAHAARDPARIATANKALEGARRGYLAANKAEGMGLTSLPGYARALARDPIGALKAGFGEQWHATGPVGKGFLVGLPAAMAGSELARAGKDEEGHGRFERAGHSLGQGVAYMAGPLSIGAQMALEKPLAGAGDRAGKFIDRSLARLQQRRHPSRVAAAPAPEPAGGDSQPEGHIWSDRAAGNVPESMST